MDEDDIKIEEPQIIEGKQENFSDLNLDELLAKHPAEEVKQEEDKKETPKEEEKEKEVVKEEELTQEEKDIKEAEEEIEGYFADEGIDEEEPEEITSDGSPQEELAKYILDGLQPINVIGTSNGKNINLNVKVADQLPDDFQFSSAKDQARFNQSISANAIHARQLADQYLNNQQQQQAVQFEAQERREIAQDIAKLQRAGELQTFTPGLKVDEDPRAETAREVLKLYEEEKNRRYEVYNREGGLLRLPSYEDIYYRWKQQKGSVNSEQKQEDTERKTITSRSAKAGRGTSVEEGQKRTGLPSTASWDQVINEALKLY